MGTSWILADMSTITGAVIAALTAITLSDFDYIHQRRKIPKLSLYGYFKIEQPFVTGQEYTKVTTYYIRAVDTNPKTEGENQVL